MTSASQATHLRSKLTTFGPSIEGTSLYLLRNIDETCDSLRNVENLARALGENSDSLGREIAKAPPTVVLDPTDAVINALEAAYNGIEVALPKMLMAKAAIDTDANLDADQRELLHCSYDTCLSAFAGMIESAKNLRAAIISHDLRAEGAPAESFDNADALLKSLHAAV